MSKKLQMFMSARAEAVARGDRKLARTMDVEIARLGYRVPERETTQAMAMEQAVPEKPRRGRPPRPRCEHGRIIGRCEDCRDYDDASVGGMSDAHMD